MNICMEEVFGGMLSGTYSIRKWGSHSQAKERTKYSLATETHREFWQWDDHSYWTEARSCLAHAANRDNLVWGDSSVEQKPQESPLGNTAQHAPWQHLRLLAAPRKFMSSWIRATGFQDVSFAWETSEKSSVMNFTSCHCSWVSGSGYASLYASFATHSEFTHISTVIWVPCLPQSTDTFSYVHAHLEAVCVLFCVLWYSSC